MLTSDDFSSGAFDPQLWNFRAPQGASAGTGQTDADAFAELVTPSGNFDPYHSRKGAQLMQAAADEDFQITTRWLSTPTERYQLQGFIIEQDTSNWVRFDVYSDGSSLHAFAAVTIDGRSKRRFDIVLDEMKPWMRLTRDGDTWTAEVSADGSNWSVAGRFNHSLNVTAAGLLSGSSADASGYVAKADFFESAASPLTSEDGTVVSSNAAPLAADDTAQTTRDKVVVIDVLKNDSDPDGNAVSVKSVSQPDHGKVIINTDGTLKYTPDSGFAGADGFTYTITDGDLTDTAAVAVTVAATTTNTAPVAGDDSFTTGGSQPATLDVLGNDSDADGDSLTITKVSQPSKGTVSILSDGSLRYTPNDGYTGLDGFTYTLSDGKLTDTATVAVTVLATDPKPSTPYSDDFSDGAIDGSVWSFKAPSGASSGIATAGKDSYATLVTPRGDFDPYHVNKAARLMQAAPDEDFQVTVKWLSTPEERYQLQGLLVEQDAGNWIRYDVYSDGTKLHAFAAVTVAGKSTRRFDIILDEMKPWMRLTRDGDNWLAEVSSDGKAWSTAGSFKHVIDVTAAGLLSGNSSTAPGYVAKADYFENAAAPIANEDGEVVAVNSAPVAADDDARTEVGAAVAIDVLKNDTDADGDSLSIKSVTAPDHGKVTIRSDGTLLYTPNPGFSGADDFTYTITDGKATDTATVSVATGDPIDVWYGDVQSFGAPGEGQRWINILGNVETTDLVSLKYTLNGGAERTLKVGPDTRRLHESGDFNVDIDYAELDGSSKHDIVRIIARYGDGSTLGKDVTVKYRDGQDWNPDYAIDWSEVDDLQDVVQVVDGKWGISGGGLRLEEPGYDRFVTIGDDGWDFFEVSLSVTTHDLYSVDPRGRDGGVFGFGLWWTGHTDDPVKGAQPKEGWNPSEWIFYYNNDPSGNFKVYGRSGSHSYKLEEDTTYNFDIRIAQANIHDRTYSMKVWEDGDAKPGNWLFEKTIAYAEPITGSFALLSHYYDVTFNDLSVKELDGGDVIKGTSAADLLIAVDTAVSRPGKGEIDTFVGGGGADLFVLGDGGKVFYDDGIASNAGRGDYAYVWDFKKGQDQIQLAGAADDYVLSLNASGLPTGTAIWLDGNAGTADELISVVKNVYDLALDSDSFVFDSLLA